MIYNDRNQYLIYFTTNDVYIYGCNNVETAQKEHQKIFFNETLVCYEMLKKIRIVLTNFKHKYKILDNKNVRIFATGIFQELSQNEKEQILIDVFVQFGVVFNIVSDDLEKFYKTIGNNDFIKGLCHQEFRNVVICGSFQQDIQEIENLMNIFEKHNVNVLSPWTTNIVPESIGTEFVLLEGQELYNERDSWRHKYDHMQKFIKADAIIICNPNGRIGKGTMFEFGFMTAYSKRIIFTNEPEGLTIHFPYEIGLNID